MVFVATIHQGITACVLPSNAPKPQALVTRIWLGKATPFTWLVNDA